MRRPSSLRRLPRRFSSDKSRDAPIVGTSGSTPLHFACANGHAPVVLTLLMHGAHPSRADKHGTTPEMLARQNGWIACADILHNWTLNKDRDLREKEELIPSQSGDGNFVTDIKHACSGPDCRICNSKRLRVKRSIDHALNMLKPSLSQLHSCSPGENIGTALETIVASPLLPSDYSGDGLVRDSPESIATGDTSGRRPSLPDVFDPSQVSTMSRRPHGGGSGSSSRRPRSAGNDAEPQTVGRRVKGKVSLLSIFRKGDASTFTLEGSSPGYASSSYTSSIPSVSGSPAPGTPRRSDLNTPNDSPIPLSKLSEETPIPDATIHGRPRGRVFSEGEATRVPPLPTAVDLHRALSDERSRTLSSPGPADVQAPDVSSGPPTAHRSPSLRPGILRPHNRSISQQSQGESPRSGSLGPPSSRSLRFDSVPTSSTAARPSSDVRRRPSQSPARAVKMSRSVSSMRSGIGVEATRSPLRTAIDLAEPPHDKAMDEHRAVFEDDDEEYGEPITTPEAITELDSRLTALQVTGEPKRNSVFSQASLSPLPSPTKVNARGFDCPFSINEPPPQYSECQPHDVESPTRQTFLSADGNENRVRGDSMSSMSTTGTGGYLPTPGMQHMQLPSPWITPSTSTPPEYPAMDHGGKGRIQRTPSSTYADAESVRAPKKGPPSALDIDIGTISSYAQAEALVQRTQRSILDLQDVVVTPQVGTAVGVGQTPLSAKLAAYGESLAIERKFRQEEERRNSSSTVRSRRPSEYSMRPPADTVDTSEVEASPGSKLDRKFSLEERSYNRTVKQSKVKRPHTAGSTGEYYIWPRLSSCGRVDTNMIIQLHQTYTLDHRPGLGDQFRHLAIFPRPGRSCMLPGRAQISALKASPLRTLRRSHPSSVQKTCTLDRGLGCPARAHLTPAVMTSSVARRVRRRWAYRCRASPRLPCKTVHTSDLSAG